MDCVHHWLIPSPGQGETGICKKCGDAREFPVKKSEWVSSYGWVLRADMPGNRRSTLGKPAISDSYGSY